MEQQRYGFSSSSAVSPTLPWMMPKDEDFAMFKAASRRCQMRANAHRPDGRDLRPRPPVSAWFSATSTATSSSQPTQASPTEPVARFVEHHHRDGQDDYRPGATRNPSSCAPAARPPRPTARHTQTSGFDNAPSTVAPTDTQAFPYIEQPPAIEPTPRKRGRPARDAIRDPDPEFGALVPKRLRHRFGDFVRPGVQRSPDVARMARDISMDMMDAIFLGDRRGLWLQSKFGCRYFIFRTLFRGVYANSKGGLDNVFGHTTPFSLDFHRHIGLAREMGTYTYVYASWYYTSFGGCDAEAGWDRWFARIMRPYGVRDVVEAQRRVNHFLGTARQMWNERPSVDEVLAFLWASVEQWPNDGFLLDERERLSLPKPALDVRDVHLEFLPKDCEEDATALAGHAARHQVIKQAAEQQRRERTRSFTSVRVPGPIGRLRLTTTESGTAFVQRDTPIPTGDPYIANFFDLEEASGRAWLYS